ncbi:MAG: T9SS type A sorting domain-containing protein [Candidatus Neomarinimicrobiota bacterium]
MITVTMVSQFQRPFVPLRMQQPSCLLAIPALFVVDTFIPKEFSLSQNYPNPFNPKTRIQFDIPKSSHTTVVVYDLLGNKVVTLIDENIMPGRHTLSWNAIDDFNRKLPSGIYFYQIQAEGFIDTKKMLLFK